MPTSVTYDFAARQRRARQEFDRHRADALLVTHLPNVRYLCGFTGSAGALLLAERRCIFLTDGRYREQARGEVSSASVVISRGALIDAAAQQLQKLRVRSVAIESDHMTVGLRDRLARQLGPGVRLRAVSGLVEQLRMIKDAAELQAIRNAVQLGCELFEPMLSLIRPGVAETDISAELEHAAHRAGAEGMSFETIVASGTRSALPHGRASAQAVPRNGFVVLDFGVILAGYCSDMTRTVHVGKAPARARQMYETLREAQQAARESVRPGVTAGEVDRAARSLLRRAGYGRFFSHSTGHGVGLEIHEAPRVARGQPDVLAPGMVITIEPGIYIAGQGGVRIEGMVAITDSGHELLTCTRRELITL
ncbi:MAG: aminopeptidase P family protein [Acidobacteriaceae bacterium]|nr:aminopeptidase P family protein [Acidobacteriaceae bacterium]